jgi:ribosome-associated protein
MDSRKLALLCRKLADDKKGEDILVLDVRKVSSVTDYFVIISATSDPHLRALSEHLQTELEGEHALSPQAVDGGAGAGWVVMDFFDVITHIMRRDVRERYDLEGLWGDAPRVRPQGRRS